MAKEKVNLLPDQKELDLKEVLGDKWSQELQDIFDSSLDKLGQITSVPKSEKSNFAQPKETETWREKNERERDERQAIREQSKENKSEIKGIINELDNKLNEKNVSDGETLEKITNLCCSKVVKMNDEKYLEDFLDVIVDFKAYKKDYVKLHNEIKKDRGVTYKKDEINRNLDRYYDSLKAEIADSFDHRVFKFNENESTQKFLENVDLAKKEGKATLGPRKFFNLYDVNQTADNLISTEIFGPILIIPAAIIAAAAPVINIIAPVFGYKEKEVTLKNVDNELKKIKEEAKNLPTIYSEKIKEYEKELEDAKLGGSLTPADEKYLKEGIKHCKAQHKKEIREIQKIVDKHSSKIHKENWYEAEAHYRKLTAKKELIKHKKEQIISLHEAQQERQKTAPNKKQDLTPEQQHNLEQQKEKGLASKDIDSKKADKGLGIAQKARESIKAPTPKSPENRPPEKKQNPSKSAQQNKRKTRGRSASF